MLSIHLDFVPQSSTDTWFERRLMNVRISRSLLRKNLACQWLSRGAHTACEINRSLVQSSLIFREKSGIWKAGWTGYDRAATFSGNRLGVQKRMRVHAGLVSCPDQGEGLVALLGTVCIIRNEISNLTEVITVRSTIQTTPEWRLLLWTIHKIRNKFYCTHTRASLCESDW